jgi:4-amino-4-deoxy-L-arabinose transferase-like glycosyltransferase
VRVGSVLARPHLAPGGDALEYLGLANGLADGRGYIEPLVYASTGIHTQTAKLPPLYPLLLSLCSLVGLKSFFAHRIWSAILGASAVALAAVVGRDIAGRRVGLIAAFVVAFYPNLWMPEGLGMSESISPVLVLIVLWAAYRMWRSPSWVRAGVLGLAIGFAALARDELILLVAFILLPLAFGGRGRSWRTRAGLLGAGVAATVLVVGPWVGYNLSRFSHPVFITDRFGAALAVANCDPAWHGPLAGFWDMGCLGPAVAGVGGDESAADPVARRAALDYVDHHLGGLPAVELERVGRTFGLYRPLEQIQLDSVIEQRPRFWAFVGLWMFYPLAVLGIGGAVILRRRGVPIFPLGAMAADVVIVTVLTYGNTRFRATLEPVLVLLTAVTVDAAVRWVGATRAAPSDAGGRPPGPSPGPPAPDERSDPTSGSEPAPAHRT